eukprot:CAMPEP_0119482802 /NCGR_PEP_ID=MMETSP1344-20130328/10503_1 /TAXON_ID=236787 /ORGANISM="Florenciella parvula, Strain CCMP2471" /LENGTH=85 /DNA_ID=CAMNT_0007517249 /DNA_START=41 /DNA_END=299 /DNA_ORIENTATION=+
MQSYTPVSSDQPRGNDQLQPPLPWHIPSAPTTSSSDANLVVRRRFQWLSVPEWACASTRASSPPQSAGPIFPLSATRPQLPKRGK